MFTPLREFITPMLYMDFYQMFYILFVISVKNQGNLVKHQLHANIN